jgi:anti-anti-sigma regulatory factor
VNGDGLPPFPGLIDCLQTTEGELTLDFATSRRIDASVLSALETLAARAGEKQVEVVLTGVSVDLYRVLKLLKLAHRFTILA